MNSHPRILVADDDPELLRTVAEALEHLGADVARADSGAEFIERLADEGPFSLIVTDVSMPWMNGLQVMHSARTAGLQTAVVVMSGLRDQRLEGQVEALGDNAVLLKKPFDLADLEGTVLRMLPRADFEAHPG